MINDEISQKLMPLSLEQLDIIQQKLEQLVEEKKEAKKRKSNLPPVAGDLDSLAAMQDMDLSSLMREISRR
ncbi:hypothetical protein IOQ59_15030 [Pontibacterium sp. N1Y112]|uniref:Uncharacterized protein n=1 Tax=Pontibacterium sinense TaxID=2781979 RepID=A0A8J7FFK4_9GAMM|nr:hypothetical protein [Pontibacterium sinense]MBE9398569.1 hypothetical protein [Pontibacterium sinense]